jgi:Zn-dependent protease with chaperone function
MPNLRIVSMVLVLIATASSGYLPGQSRTPTVSAQGKKIKLNGYAEYRKGDILIVEGQQVLVGADVKFKGAGIPAPDRIPMGYEVKVEGLRQPDGLVVARKLEAKPNGVALFEPQVLQVTNTIEQEWVKSGRMFEPTEEGKEVQIGRIVEQGPQVDRVHRIMDRLRPPHLKADDIRARVVDTKEWNAAAMGNGAIWVYSGLLNEMSDDELAVILGHELAHYTHEHSRRQAKRNMIVQMIAMGGALSAEALGSDRTAQIVGLSAMLGLTVYAAGYSRDLEDQADRVGLRYAHEGGFDVSRAVPLWQRFRGKYGEADTISNFFFGSHSRPTDRIRNIESELSLNYR